VQNLDDLSHLDEETKPIAEVIVKQSKPMGVIGFAGWSYRKGRIDQAVDVRILVFRDYDLALKWWKLKREAAEAFAGENFKSEPICEFGDFSAHSEIKLPAIKSTAYADRVLIDNVAIVTESGVSAEVCRRVFIHYVHQVFPKLKDAKPSS
jgi:hypothetical protein